jgi:hypothetical protein
LNAGKRCLGLAVPVMVWAGASECLLIPPAHYALVMAVAFEGRIIKYLQFWPYSAEISA